MLTRRLVAAGIVAMVAGILSVRAFGQARDPIAGPWERVAGKNLTTGTALPEPNPPEHVIYSNGHYVQFTAAWRSALHDDGPRGEIYVADTVSSRLHKFVTK